jgi:hypothetical protein
MDLFKISNFGLCGMAIEPDFYSSLEGYRKWEWQRDRREKTSRLEEIMLDMIRKQRYVSEPIETKYLKCWLLILLWSKGI